MNLNWNRTLSGFLAVIYAFAGFAGRGPEGACLIALSVLFPLACIWFGEAMGGHTGPASGIAITQTSPGMCVRILGWALMLMPLLVFLL